MAAAALLSVALSGTAPASAHDETVRQYTYVAHDFHVVGPDLLADAIAAQIGVRTAPLGHVRFDAFAERFTVRIQDVGPFPTIAVIVLSGETRSYLCLPNGGSAVVEGLVPGEQVHLFVPDPTLTRCGGATAGTLTIAP